MLLFKNILKYALLLCILSSPFQIQAQVCGYLLPENNKRLFFIGQDLQSVTGYINNCENCPTPSGITTYLNLADILTPNFYGALGWTENDVPYGQDIDWGGGPLNAHSSAAGFPNSSVQIGLYLKDQTDGINNGVYDAQIIQLADFFKSLSNTAFYLRIGYEFDGAWNGYNPTSYSNAYKYMVDLLRSENVTNVAYVWQSSTSPIDDIIDGGQESLLPYYPGDEYVDWLGLSWFLLSEEQAVIGNTVSTQLVLLDELVSLAREKQKPVMIAEAANQGYDNANLINRNISSVWDGQAGQNSINKTANEIWAEWYAPFFNYIEDNSDVIKAVSYINANWDVQDLWNPPYEQGYWGDSRIETNAIIENNWTAEMAKPEWEHGSNNLNTIIGLNTTNTNCTTLSTNNFEPSKTIKIYPNPALNKLFLAETFKNTAFSIFDISGRLVSKSVGNIIDVSKLSPGTYILSNKASNSLFIKK